MVCLYMHQIFWTATERMQLALDGWLPHTCPRIGYHCRQTNVVSDLQVSVGDALTVFRWEMGFTRCEALFVSSTTCSLHDT